MAHRLDDTRSGAVTDESTVAVPEDEEVAARIPLLRRRRSCWRWWLRSHRSEYGGAGGTSRARERRSGSQLTRWWRKRDSLIGAKLSLIARFNSL
jgi:hypothetical protein